MHSLTISHMHRVHSDSTYLQSSYCPPPTNPPLRLPLVFLSFCFDSLCNSLSLTNSIDMCLSMELSNGCGGWTCGYITKVNDSFSSHTQQQPIVPQREVETSSICDLMQSGPALCRPIFCVPFLWLHNSNTTSCPEDSVVHPSFPPPFS